MTKNDGSTEKQTIRIVDADGHEIGRTYPRRAAGLIKKGRACYMNDSQIRLYTSGPISNSEVKKMNDNKQNETFTAPQGNTEGNVTVPAELVNRLYFNPRKWSMNKECKNGVGIRSVIQGPAGELDESYMIGSWDWQNWSEIISETMLLPKNTLHTFSFWLNGGENDRADEVCRFEIIFNNNWDDRYTFNLNRNFIRPLKKLNGWEYYEIPFRTLDNEYTQFKFIAHKAYMTVLPAKELSAYDHVQDNPDPYEAQRPQRPNLVFSDGFPATGWYSTKALANDHSAQHGGATASATDMDELHDALESCQSALSELLTRTANAFTFNSDSIIQTVDTCLRGHIRNALDSISGVTDADEIADRLQDALSDSLEEIRDAVEEVRDSFEEYQDTLDEVMDDFTDLSDSLQDI